CFFKLSAINFVSKTTRKTFESAYRLSPFHELLMSGARIMPQYFYLATALDKLFEKRRNRQFILVYVA
ncbi:MAG: hypothetical protein Q7W55_13670, partial [Pseudohongiella sp.]|nr:hypothetical protein [Pseudohongiella sp.]MDO9521756.1 hypothetical protein [Pseudohongiella sp.]MDP2128298.1 hypothetical protein [Pseudohongiella sp.]